MKKFAALLCMVMTLCLGVTAFAGEDLDASKKVSKVEVGQLPAKTAYVIGETFSLEGGTVVVSYDDGTTDEIPMSAPSITVKEPGMKASGTKTVQLKVGGKNVRFTVAVANNSFAVTYDQNYEGAPAPEQVETVKGEKAENKQYTREGYTLVGWYENPDFTTAWNFKTEITQDVTLYALWTRDGADYANVTFDYDYYGVALSKYAYPVEIGTAVARPQNDPVRTGYAFAGWVDENGAAYDFTAAIAADVTIKASWEKAVSGRQTYVFEAEDTNLTGKTGPAISGTANEIGMIMANDGVGASNGRYVGYMYQYGNTVDFYIAADEQLTDVLIQVSLSAEMEGLSLNPANYGVSLNGVYLDYGVMEITDVPPMNWETYVADPAPFKTYVVAVNATLNQGRNVIKLETLNNESYAGTTMLAHAPLIDCLTIETEGVVIWDENFGVPALENYKK